MLDLGGAGSGTNWRILNNSEEAGTQPVASAAPLLFQAPQFVPPAPAPESGNDSADDQPVRGSSKGKGKAKGKGAKKDTAPTDSSNGGNDQSSPAPAEGSGEQDARAGKGNKSGKSGKSGKSNKASAAKGDADDRTPEDSQTADDGTNGGDDSAAPESEGSSRRRRRRSRSSSGSDSSSSNASSADPRDEVQALQGSTRLEAKRLRRREGRRDGRRRQSITEAEFLARREAVDRQMVVRHHDGLDQIAVLEDELLVEHYVARRTQQSIVGNIYLGRVQNVLPSMEAAFIDIGRGRNAVLYAGEVNWDALGMEGKPRRIEQALKSGDAVLVQATKDPIGHKGARLTSQITLAGRYLVLVPGSNMVGISRKLPDNERQRLKKILKDAVPEGAGVIVRTAAEGATEEQLRADIDRLSKQAAEIDRKKSGTKKAPQLLRGEPELAVRVVRDIFNEDFKELIVQGDETWNTVSEYVEELSPELSTRLTKWTGKEDVFHAKRIDQQLAKGMDRKVWLPSGGTLVIDRTEALTVVDVNTGKFIGAGGTLEETVTRNNLEAAEEIVRQLRLRDIGGIIIIDFVDMVLESNRELVLRRLIECLGRDRTRHQVTEITSLGLVQMTRKRVGEGLVEAFSTTCEACEGRGFIVHEHPVEIAIETPKNKQQRGKQDSGGGRQGGSQKGGAKNADKRAEKTADPVSHVGEEKVKTALNAIAAATVAEPEAAAPQSPGRGLDDKPSPTPESTAGSATKDTDEPRGTGPRRRRVVVRSSGDASGTEANPEQVNAEDMPKRDLSDITLPDRASAPATDVSAGHHTVTVGAQPKRRRRVTSQPAERATKRRARPEDATAAGSENASSAQEAVRDLLGS